MRIKAKMLLPQGADEQAMRVTAETIEAAE